ncbi:MAG: PHB depolymerase family esterase [Thiolinea sp.]
MSSPWFEKLNSYVRRTGNWLSGKWEQLRFRWAGEAEPEPAAPLAVPDDLSGRMAEAVLPEVSDDFETRLRVAAAREHAMQPLQGQARERSCPAGESWFSRRRDYLVYTPAGYDGHERLPLVVVLHGCRQTQHDIRAISGFDAIADRERFIVVYPFVTGYWSPRNRNCWAWWMSFHIRAGSGEVEDIGRIVAQVQDEFRVDPQRIHITGLSSGAGMTVAALVAHGRLFASGASVAGVAYGETARAVRISAFLPIRYRPLRDIVGRMCAEVAASGRGHPAPLLVIQSAGDETVELQAGLNLRDSWLAVKGIDAEQVQIVRENTRDINWHYLRYGQPGSAESVDFLSTEKLPHAWIGGLPGDYSDARGPNISEVIWLYFRSTSTG